MDEYTRFFIFFQSQNQVKMLRSLNANSFRLHLTFPKQFPAIYYDTVLSVFRQKKHTQFHLLTKGYWIRTETDFFRHIYDPLNMDNNSGPATTVPISTGGGNYVGLVDESMWLRHLVHHGAPKCQNKTCRIWLKAKKHDSSMTFWSIWIG